MKAATSPVFGVDSSSPVTSQLYDAVVKWAGHKPEFWFRYLGNFIVRTDEVVLLHSLQTKVGLVYNLAKPTLLELLSQGAEDGHKAVELARGVGAPRGVTLFADIEHGWPLTTAWLEGWTRSITEGGYAAGVYLSPNDWSVQKTLVVFRSTRPELWKDLVLWFAYWLGEESWVRSNEIDIPSSRPFTQTLVNDHSSVWQFAGEVMSGKIDLDVYFPGFGPEPKFW
ncbi:MAG: DUF1906 domain-containing protein [Patescibacteria group bacterium]|nr:DUF1906 domain-containing protein [Patescibacteria group bacterium]